ncbi:glutathione S-transferase family protein [Cohaesibacter sp. CAU 1516]|uniref:glutathione S-transferase family protein n=1 Tax=Cohaesibacter sp. CAU 1516 TaxID=2576038 RepID=UPI001FEEFA0A|nr:glutathione S-transferase family protein [Cohaesibacter sp. CAU 1516]
MKFLISPTSPYSSKVCMAARFCNIEAECATVVTTDDPDVLIENNPLGKIPTLLTDDGKAIFDSRAIMQFLNRESGGMLYPEDPSDRTDVEVLEALGDGITDCLLAQAYEIRFRPDDKIYQLALDRQWEKVARGLDRLQVAPPTLADGLNGGHLALAGMAGYLALRFAGRWEEQWPWINEFMDAFRAHYPALAERLPKHA